MDQDKIGKFIAELRKGKNLTQSELAEKLGITDRAVSKWENGRGLPDLSLIKDLCDQLGITVDELLCGERKTSEGGDEAIISLLNYSSETIKKYKQKMLFSLMLVISILPMFLTQYGGARGVQEVSGTINLLNPVGAVSVVLFLLGVWYEFQGKSRTLLLGGIGIVGLVVSEIYNFLTWNMYNYAPIAIDVARSFRNAFPEYYLGLAVSVAMAIWFFAENKKHPA